MQGRGWRVDSDKGSQLVHPTLVLFRHLSIWKLEGALLGAELDEVWPCQRIVSSWGCGESLSGSNQICCGKVVSRITWWWGAGGPVTPLLHVRAIFLCPVLMSTDLAHLGWKVGLANSCKLFESIEPPDWCRLSQLTVFAGMFSLPHIFTPMPPWLLPSSGPLARGAEHYYSGLFK